MLYFRNPWYKSLIRADCNLIANSSFTRNLRSNAIGASIAPNCARRLVPLCAAPLMQNGNNLRLAHARMSHVAAAYLILSRTFHPAISMRLDATLTATNVSTLYEKMINETATCRRLHVILQRCERQARNVRGANVRKQHWCLACTFNCRPWLGWAFDLYLCLTAIPVSMHHDKLMSKISWQYTAILL